MRFTDKTFLAEIDEAVTTIKKTGNDQLVLLKCTSVYPSPPGEVDYVRFLI